MMLTEEFEGVGIAERIELVLHGAHRVHDNPLHRCNDLAKEGRSVE
jgi:hypothetical protein